MTLQQWFDKLAAAHAHMAELYSALVLRVSTPLCWLACCARVARSGLVVFWKIGYAIDRGILQPASAQLLAAIGLGSVASSLMLVAGRMLLFLVHGLVNRAGCIQSICMVLTSGVCRAGHEHMSGLLPLLPSALVCTV